MGGTGFSVPGLFENERERYLIVTCSSSPASGSGLMAQSLESVSDSVSPSLSAPPPFMLCLSHPKINRGAWVAQLVKRLTSAQVTISRSVGLSPASGSGLMAQSLEPASGSVSPSLSAPPPLALCLSLALKIN